MPKKKGNGFQKKDSSATIDHLNLLGPHWSSTPWSGGQLIDVSRVTTSVKRASTAANGTLATKSKRLTTARSQLLGLVVHLTFSTATTTKERRVFNSAGAAGPFDRARRDAFALECIALVLMEHGDPVTMAAGPPDAMYFKPARPADVCTALGPSTGFVGGVKNLDLAVDTDSFSDSSSSSSDSESEAPPTLAPEPEDHGAQQPPRSSPPAAPQQPPAQLPPCLVRRCASYTLCTRA